MASIVEITDIGGQPAGVAVATAAGGTAPAPVVAVVDSTGTALSLKVSTVSSAPQFTRPNDTTAYASGDLVANSTTAGSVVPLAFANAARVAAGSGTITRARLKKSTVTTANADFRLHLYRATQTVANGDNGAWSSSGAADYIGSLDFANATGKAFTDGYANQIGAAAPGIIFKLSAGTTLYGLLEARAAYAPGAQETFNISLEIQQD